MLQVSWVAADSQLCLWRTPPSVRAHLNSWSGPGALGTESLSVRRLFLLWTHTCHTRPAAASQGALGDSPAPRPYGTYCSWSTDAQMPTKRNNIFYLCSRINSFIFPTFCLLFHCPHLRHVRPPDLLLHPSRLQHNPFRFKWANRRVRFEADVVLVGRENLNSVVRRIQVVACTKVHQ